MSLGSSSYFYSRLGKDGARFVSNLTAQESELTEQNGDLSALVDELSGSNSAIGPVAAVGTGTTMVPGPGVHTVQVDFVGYNGCFNPVLGQGVTTYATRDLGISVTQL